jgi:hypothetical protein
VRVLALSLVVAQIVTCGKRIFDRNFVHEPLLADGANTGRTAAHDLTFYFTSIEMPPRLI